MDLIRLRPSSAELWFSFIRYLIPHGNILSAWFPRQPRRGTRKIHNRNHIGICMNSLSFQHRPTPRNTEKSVRTHMLIHTCSFTHCRSAAVPLLCNGWMVWAQGCNLTPLQGAIIPAPYAAHHCITHTHLLISWRRLPPLWLSDS